jgi:hypothetical protein
MKRARKVKNLNDVRRIIHKQSEKLKELKIRRLMVFGSFARGDQKSSSDIDLLVEFTEPIGFFHFYDVKFFLENVLGRHVDLVVEDAIRPEFEERIMRELVSAS